MQLVRRQSALRRVRSGYLHVAFNARAQAYPARPIRLIVPYAGEGIFL
jgi:tripartite-type tricarboxylate transporter receptor subunit TctC